ncbi:MAG: hypothetical protein AAB738_02560 [Patescibacteria group bacterium]
MDIKVIVCILKEFFIWLWEIIKHPFFVSLMTYFIFDAIIRYRRVVGEIDSKLLFYLNAITSLGSINTDMALARKLECSHELRKLAGDLGAAYNAVFIKSLFSLIRLIPSQEDVQKAVKELGALSNHVFDSNKGNNKGNTVKDIRDLLKIPPRWI